MVELKEKRLRKSLSEAKNEWQGQKDLNFLSFLYLDKTLQNQCRSGMI